MTDSQLETVIDQAWEDRDSIGLDTQGAVREAVEAALAGLDNGSIRTAVPLGDHQWQVNQWAKKAVLLSFRLNDMDVMPGGPAGPGSDPAMASSWWDKVPSKFAGWSAADFRAAGFRAVPNCVVRRAAYIAPSVVLMPSFVNLAPMSTAAPWSTPGRPSGPARKSVKTFTCRGRRHRRCARTPTGRPGDHRGRLFHRRPQRGGRGRRG